MPVMDLPLDGAISRYCRDEAPPEVRRLIAQAGKDGVTHPDWPYPEEMKRRDYDAAMGALQIELVRLQAWVKEAGARLCLIFEGRDAAGKGGTIKAVTENLNPRGARVVALPKPTELEATQWYFQRYVEQLPSAGEIVLFDRSWYNRGVVEHVFGFCTPEERARWFDQVNPFEAMLVEEGILLWKFWLDIHRATQIDRFLARERDPLKQWKLSWIDAEGLKRWDDYSAAIAETLARTHSAAAPWTVVRADDKRRLRLNLIRTILAPLPYARKDSDAIGAIDPLIVGGPEMVPGIAGGAD
jgi:polyphosphate kinase 2